MPELCVLHAHCAALWIQDPIVLLPSRHQRSLTDTDAACRRLKLVKQPRLTCLSGKERESRRKISLSGSMLCVLEIINAATSTRAETEPNGSRNSVRQFVNSFQTRAHIAIKTQRLSSTLPPPFLHHLHLHLVLVVA